MRNAQSPGENRQGENEFGGFGFHRLLRYLFFDAERIDDAGDPFGIFVDEFLDKRRRSKKSATSRAFPVSSFQAADSVAPWMILISASRCCVRDARRAEGAAPIGQLDVDGLFFERGISFDFLSGSIPRARACARL